MFGHCFKIKHLPALVFDMVEKAGFGGACAAINQDDVVGQRRFIKSLYHETAIAFIASLHHIRAPSDLLQDGCE